MNILNFHEPLRPHGVPLWSPHSPHLRSQSSPTTPSPMTVCQVSWWLELPDQSLALSGSCLCVRGVPAGSQGIGLHLIPTHKRGMRSVGRKSVSVRQHCTPPSQHAHDSRDLPRVSARSCQWLRSLGDPPMARVGQNPHAFPGTMACPRQRVSLLPHPLTGLCLAGVLMDHSGGWR